MTPVDKELAEEIKKGVSLEKVDEADLKAREAEKEKRRQELEKVREALGDK